MRLVLPAVGLVLPAVGLDLPRVEKTKLAHFAHCEQNEFFSLLAKLKLHFIFRFFQIFPDFVRTA